MEKITSRIISTASVFALVVSMTSCAAMKDKISKIGEAPEMAKIESPYKDGTAEPVSYPMPLKEVDSQTPNSLWGNGKQTFFKDQRASEIGDILTVNISIDDKADLDNTTERTREGAETNGLTNLFGLAESQLDKVLPADADNTSLVDMDSSSSSKGDGSISRSEEIDLKLAAIIIQKLPNGNFVIQGHQQMRVNNELRDLTLQGIIRPQDILNDNSISYEKIAEARISYGGKGNISELQQTRYGQQFFEAVLPF
jgi:flagellar L-ring protein precursor FlgH